MICLSTSNSQATVKLRNNRLNKIITGSKLRITKRNFPFKEWSYELFLTTRQENRYTQLSKIIQSRKSIGAFLGF